MNTLSANKECTPCHHGNSLLCNGCKNASYCTKACQQSDWPIHKLLCSTFFGFDDSRRPTKNHIRVISFPVDESNGKFLWLRCDHAGLDFDVIFGRDETPEEMKIHHNLRSLKEITLCFRGDFYLDESKPNKSIKSITATKSGRCYDWEGPVFAYGCVESEGCANSQDLDMTEFRYIADFFLSYVYTPPSTTQEPPIAMISGVRINCLGDQEVLNKPKFEAVKVSSTDIIFDKHDTSDIAKLIGLPILTQRCPPGSSNSSLNNQDATFLHLCCDPDAEFSHSTGVLGWGWASQSWQIKVGSIIVVRQDKKPLYPLHMEALCRYCQYEIQPLLGHSIGEYSPEESMTKEAVLAMINRPTFVIHWNKLIREKIKAGEDTDVPFHMRCKLNWFWRIGDAARGRNAQDVG